MELQEQDKKKKVPLWVHLVGYIILFFLIILAIFWILSWLDVPGPWKSSRALKIFSLLGVIFGVIFSSLKAIFDKDVRQLFFQWLFSKPSSNDSKSSTENPSSEQSPVHIDFHPSITVSPSQNVSLQSAAIEIKPSQSDANTPSLGDPSVIQPDREISGSYEQKEAHGCIPNQSEQHPMHTTLLADPGSIFVFNEHLPHQDELFGRELDRQTLISRTRNGASTSIVGARRIGKTWLIEYLGLVAKDQLGSSFRIGYIDATEPSCATVAGFTARALEELGMLSSHVGSPNVELAALEKTVRDLKFRNSTPVLCIDEFEGFGNRQLFSLNFFTGLRAMTQAGLVLVVASKKPLIDLVGRDGETSGFFNVFEQLTLKPFDIGTAKKFTQLKGTQAGFTKHEHEMLLKYGQTNGTNGVYAWPPIRLQLVGKMLLADKLSHEYHLDHLDNPYYWQDFGARLEENYRSVVL